MICSAIRVQWTSGPSGAYGMEALLIQRRLKCSDQQLVKHVGENPYLQYFIGMKGYGSCPFGASALMAFRKRFSEQELAAIPEASAPKAETEKAER